MRTKLNLENDARRRLREWVEGRERERERKSEKVIEMKK